VLSRPQRNRLADLWGREPNLGPDEILERNLLEARLRGEAPNQDGISAGLAEEMRASLEELVEWEQNTGGWEAPCWNEAKATLGRVYAEKRGLTQIEGEMVEVLGELWNRSDKMDAEDAPELTAATERIMTSIDKLIGTKELAPALLDALESHLHRWDNLDDEDSPDLGESLRAVVAKADQEGVVGGPLPDGELPTRPEPTLVPVKSHTAVGELAARAAELSQLARFCAQVELVLQGQGFRSLLTPHLSLAFQKDEALVSGLKMSKYIRFDDTRLNMTGAYQIRDEDGNDLEQDQMFALPTEVPEVLRWFDQVQDRVIKRETPGGDHA
jgi:hypothetical protein